MPGVVGELGRGREVERNVAFHPIDRIFFYPYSLSALKIILRVSNDRSLNRELYLHCRLSLFQPFRYPLSHSLAVFACHISLRLPHNLNAWKTGYCRLSYPR